MAYNGRVYVTGGQGAEPASEATVFGARIEAAGTIERWVELTPLPRPRSHHASFIHGGALYVVGGLDGNPAAGPALLTDVQRAEIRPDGTLREWRLVSLMPHAYGTHATVVHADYVWVVGGVEDNFRFVDTVWRAPIQPDGRIGAWEEARPGLPSARGHVHDTPVPNGRVYSVGGSHSRRVTGETQIGTFQP